MKNTIKVTTGETVKSFFVASTQVAAFLAEMQTIANETNVACAFECYSERRGVYNAGVMLPQAETR